MKPTIEQELAAERRKSLWNVKGLLARFEADMDVLEAKEEYASDSPDRWVLDLENGITVTRMTQSSDPRSWPGINFIFHIDGKRFAILGMSQVHDQLYLAEPEPGFVDPDCHWHRACNSILEWNNVPYRLLHPANTTVGYQKKDQTPGLSHHRKLMREENGQLLGTTFMASFHGSHWFRCEPLTTDERLDRYAEDKRAEDYHILYCLGLVG